MVAPRPDIAFIPTPDDAIAAMLDLAQVQAQDVVYDLGCGDGRLLIRAAQQRGAQGVGIDIDPVRIAEARAAARAAGVAEQVVFHQGNLYEAEFRAATVIFLYLMPHLNERLIPALRAQAHPGTRIVSHQFPIGDWQPQEVLTLEPSEEDSTLYLWVMP